MADPFLPRAAQPGSQADSLCGEAPGARGEVVVQRVELLHPGEVPSQEVLPADFRHAREVVDFLKRSQAVILPPGGSGSAWPWPFLLCTGCRHTVAVSGTRAEGGSRHSGATVPLASGLTRLYLKPLHVHDSFQRDRAVRPVHNPFFFLPHLLQATHLGCPTHCGEREVSVPAWPRATSPGTVAGWGKKQPDWRAG